MPWDLTQSLRARVAALPEAAREALRVAALVGREAPRTLLTALSARGDAETQAALAEACRAGLLVEAGEASYSCAHDVIREVVEADLGTGGRAILHRRIAQAMERGQAGEPSVEAIAYHYARTDEQARAAHWLERAGDRAAAGFANAAALGNYAAARDRLVACGANADALSRLDEKQGDLRLRMGEFGPAGEDFARAREGAHEPARRAELRRKEGVSWEKRGEYDRALSTFALAAREGQSAHGDSALPLEMRATLELSRGEAYYAQGEYATAAAAADRARVLLVAEQPHPAPNGEPSNVSAELVLAHADELQGRVAWSRGDLAWAEQCHRRSLAPRERAGDQTGMATCWHNLGHVAFDRGDLEQAEDCFRRSLTIRDRIGDQEGMAACWNNVGNVAGKRADLGAAEQCYRRSLELHERMGDQEGVGLAYHNLGVVAYRRNDLAAAEECFHRSLAIA